MQHNLKNLITLEYIDSMMQYDPDSGLMYWLKDKQQTKRGDQCAHFCRTTNVYKVRMFGKDVSLATLIWIKHHRKKPTGILSFKDGDTTNTKIENLVETSKNFPKKSWLYDPQNVELNRLGDKRLKQRTCPQKYKTLANRGILNEVEVSKYRKKDFNIIFHSGKYKYFVMNGKRKLFEFRNENLAKKKLMELKK